MTRKDYVAIAGAFAGNRPAPKGSTDYSEGYHDGATDMHRELCNAISVVLAADNPRFDRERFYRACEGGK